MNYLTQQDLKIVYIRVVNKNEEQEAAKAPLKIIIRFDVSENQAALDLLEMKKRE
jgi:hypothetical protein